MAAQKRPHHALTLEKKVEIINDFESGSFTKTALATKHAIPKSSLTRILHDKEKLRAAFSSSRFGAQRKRLRLGNHEELEKCLVLWLRRARSQNLPINGPIIRAKAEEFVLQLGIEGFSCSEGWFTRFKERNGLVFRAVSGESAAVDVSACQNWQAGRLPEILREYKPQDIYNVDETALFFKLLPTKSLSFKGERCTGGKLSKERVSVLVGANMDGSDKLKPLVIGKSKHPRCFKNVATLPVLYESNSKAWMTQAIFGKWINGEDARFSREKRKVVFLVDNCPGHGVVQGLRSIMLEFLPANTTALLQPMDQGVIQALKACFRRSLLQRMLICMDQGKEYKVDILRAIYLLDHAWSQVKPSTVANCFRHAGFASTPAVEVELEEPIEEQDLSEEFNRRGLPFDLDEYVQIDSEVATCSENTVESIVAEICNEGSEEEAERPDDEAAEEVVTLQQADSALQTLKIFFQREQDSELFLQSLSAMDDVIQRKRLRQSKQTKIDFFFAVQ